MAKLHGLSALLGRFVVPLLLLMISVHALTPLGQPLQRLSGSAFSAETTEVSLRSGQRGAIVKQSEITKPPVPIPAVAFPLALVQITAFTVLVVSVPGLGPTGPPLTERIGSSPLLPRAPPAI